MSFPALRSRASFDDGLPAPQSSPSDWETTAVEEREALYIELGPLVKGLVRHYGVDPDLREELPGEIYCQFVRLLNAYDAARGIPLRPYLIRGLKAAVYTTARGRWRRRAREVALCGGLDRIASMDDPTPQWDHTLWQQEILATLPSLIHDLPDRQRRVLIWRFYEQRSFEEMARYLRVQPSTVRSLLRHGINNLRRRVAVPPGDVGL